MRLATRPYYGSMWVNGQRVSAPTHQAFWEVDAAELGLPKDHPPFPIFCDFTMGKHVLNGMLANEYGTIVGVTYEDALGADHFSVITHRNKGYNPDEVRGRIERASERAARARVKMVSGVMRQLLADVEHHGLVNVGADEYGLSLTWELDSPGLREGTTFRTMFKLYGIDNVKLALYESVPGKKVPVKLWNLFIRDFFKSEEKADANLAQVKRELQHIELMRESRSFTRDMHDNMSDVEHRRRYRAMGGKTPRRLDL